MVANRYFELEHSRRIYVEKNGFQLEFNISHAKFIRIYEVEIAKASEVVNLSLIYSWQSERRN